ncbi:uncharacterized protein UTRI_03626_B [Ustilago trichophora]|uniref:Uncharacterized protein n=1 Tax=Ustilago trichophora TaxID=86804 RepID=A0A5C3DZG6_9BASI|nr:uncharacterized protein UTRI_03626_B [Ustilago trichophora]
MPVRQRGGSPVAGNGFHGTLNQQQETKPKIKPEPFVIDLCNSDDEHAIQPGPSEPATRPKRPAAGSSRLKYEDDSQPCTDNEDQNDDFCGSANKRRGKMCASSSTPTTAPKLYAIARIGTLATDGVASVSQSEAKLANVSSGILSRIQKSLALAKHPGTGEAEAQQALRLATRLMSSQNLTQADILASSSAETNQTRAGMSIVEIVSQTNASPRNESWVNQVAIAINLFFDVKAYSTSYANRTKLSWTFYGLAINTVAAAHAFEMVHNQVLTWAYEKASAKLVSGKTGKNSYCQGVAAGLIALAKKEKKEEMRLAIESEKKRLKDAEEQEAAQTKKEKERLEDPPVSSVKSEPGIKPERQANGFSGSSASRSRNVQLEDAIDEEDIKPFRNGVKRSASEQADDGYGRWTDSGFGSTKLEHDHDSESDNEDAHDRFYDLNSDLPTPAFEEDIKPHFDEALESDIIDLTSDLDNTTSPSSADIQPKPDPESEDIKPKLEPEDNGAGWQSGNQLIRFRQDAEKIADDYLNSQHSGLKFKKRAKTTFKKDSSAFEQGREDAKKIDVKRKRIQG